MVPRPEVELRLVPTQMKKEWVAVSGPRRAVEIEPSRWRSPVSRVRSRGTAGYPSDSLSGLTRAWIAAIQGPGMSGWLVAVTVQNSPSV